jgi:hypothetical protein
MTKQKPEFLAVKGASDSGLSNNRDAPLLVPSANDLAASFNQIAIDVPIVLSGLQSLDSKAATAQFYACLNTILQIERNDEYRVARNRISGDAL